MTERKYLNQIKKDWEYITSSPLILEAKEWYPREREWSSEMAKNYSIDLQQVTGMYAAFSPLKSVKENKKILINFLNGSRYGHTSRQINKAELILNTTDIDEIDVILNGQKTVAFHRHIFNPLDKRKVVIDTHLIKYFNVGNIIHITPKRYSIYENSIKKWANKVNMYPSEVQAAVWLLAKEKYGINI